MKVICGSMNWTRFWNFFLDLTHFSKAICLKDINSEYFVGFAKYFWIVPFRLSYLLRSSYCLDTPQLPSMVTVQWSCTEEPMRRSFSNFIYRLRQSRVRNLCGFAHSVLSCFAKKVAGLCEKEQDTSLHQADTISTGKHNLWKVREIFHWNGKFTTRQCITQWDWPRADNFTIHTSAIILTSNFFDSLSTSKWCSGA